MSHKKRRIMSVSANGFRVCPATAQKSVNVAEDSNVAVREGKGEERGRKGKSPEAILNLLLLPVSPSPIGPDIGW